jgi:putative hydrolase of the HAD superfamily
MPLRALLVDVDGVVVVHPDPLGWSGSLEADLGVSPARLSSEFFRPYWDDVICGRAGLYERLSPVLAAIAPHLTSRELTDYWFRRDSQLDDRLLAELATIRATGVSLHLVTVQEHERARHLWEDVGLSQFFDAMHYSAELGVAKPDPAFFAAVEARVGLPPSDLFFIDDKEENVEGARARRWPAAVWTGDRTLSAVLDDGRVDWRA